jgi:S-formylglutathione hydrolase
LITALNNPGMFKSVSAFSPIVHPSACPWGIKAFSGYLLDKSEWAKYDACELVRKYNGPRLKILIDQGEVDNFLKEQLLTNDFVEACQECDLIELDCRMQPGFDHSYWFISTFIDDHLEFHYSFLK